MKIDVLTLFPEFFESFKDFSIVGRAIRESIVEINYTNIRDFSRNKHKKVDDYPYGGGPGMLMSPEPIVGAIESVQSENSTVYYLSPKGRPYSQAKAMELSKKEHIILLSGHYEGIDQRVIDNYVDEEISIGDYVLTGGEIPAMVIMDSVIRLLDGVLSSSESYLDESHSYGLLEYPQYTRPDDFRGFKVPEVLLSGNHGEIDKWRKARAIEITAENRPDLLEERRNK